MIHVKKNMFHAEDGFLGKIYYRMNTGNVPIHYWQKREKLKVPTPGVFPTLKPLRIA